jgi:hypothetical protein
MRVSVLSLAVILGLIIPRSYLVGGVFPQITESPDSTVAHGLCVHGSPPQSNFRGSMTRSQHGPGGLYESTVPPQKLCLSLSSYNCFHGPGRSLID